MAKVKRPRDPSQLAKLITEIATGQVQEEPVKTKKIKPGPTLGGKARAEKLSSKRRQEIAQKAAKARWNNR